MHNVKITWKSIVAVCVLAVSLIAEATNTGLLPKNAAAVLGTASLVALAIERFAESQDFKTAVSNPEAAAQVLSQAPKAPPTP